MMAPFIGQDEFAEEAKKAYEQEMAMQQQQNQPQLPPNSQQPQLNAPPQA
jgi:hypothetical protein